jgi:hypothetical protein
MFDDPFAKGAQIWQMIYGEAGDRMSQGTMPVPEPDPSAMSGSGEAGTAPTDFWHDLMSVPRDVTYDPSRDDTAGFYRAIAAKLNPQQQTQQQPAIVSALQQMFAPETQRALKSMAKGGSVSQKPMGALAQVIAHNILTAIATNPKAAREVVDYIVKRGAGRNHGAR